MMSENRRDFSRLFFGIMSVFEGEKSFESPVVHLAAGGCSV